MNNAKLGCTYCNVASLLPLSLEISIASPPLRLTRYGEEDLLLNGIPEAPIPLFSSLMITSFTRQLLLGSCLKFPTRAPASVLSLTL
jgi:hypothetical protein